MSFWQPGSKQPADQKSSGNDKKNIPQGNDKKAAPLSNEKKGQETRASNSSVGADGRASLSKGVMTMKFMKRKSDADAEGKQMAEKRRKQLDSAWTSEGTDNITSNENDVLVCTKEEHDFMSALPGRRSFGGFNKAVERNYEQIMDEKRFDKASERASKNSISDTEMLARYENLIGLPRGPNQGMRPKNEKKMHKKDPTSKI